MVYAPRGVGSISSRGSIVFIYVLFWFSKHTLKKKGHPSTVILPGFFPRNVLFDGIGWGGMGWDGVGWDR